MPPKTTRKAKAGAILSGISRAGPGKVDIGSMVPQVTPSVTFEPILFQKDRQSGQERVDAEPTPSFTASSDIVGMYCHFCCEATQPGYRYQCIECGALMCEQTVQKSKGCIYLGSVENKDDFLCTVCFRTSDKKDQPLPYAYIGFGQRKKVKMAWPMAVVNLNLESMKDDYLATTVKIELENHYRMHPHNLFIQTLRMRGAAHLSESRKLSDGLKFMRSNVGRGFPPNTFIVVDTHSDEFTGMLQHTGGHTGGTNTTITEIIEAYLGTEFLKCMGEASDAARTDNSTFTTAKSTKPWCDLTSRARGGWRGLLLVSCGPAMRVSHHFESVLKLVKSNQFEVIVGFGGSGTLPSMVSHTVRSFVVDTGVFGRTDPWSAICHMLTSNHDVLDYTTAVVVYATAVNGCRQIECRQIAKDAPGLRAFGYEFRSCGKPGCNPVPADLRVFNQKERVRVRCLKCGWRSAWARTDKDNKHFKRVNALAAPQLFWHHFPPSADLQNFFVDLTERQNAIAAQSAQISRKRGGESKRKKTLQKFKNRQQDAEMLDLTGSHHSPAMDVDE
ncbi:uncharacterized protein F5891DRAFT_1199920 [Suillus fuscotomentosus]|uniref:Uncharacterized protein n=1 Tax=Suillus fuscotomentosus TaxID=1912939 RepID=A0AAD4HBA4_9AGAM|nr:uncharacterized protein F5891DRAFT_1199920 [Suillus fuscotomentosus]KAG1887457.1 hypothetical protein F5891DRAFT_1199920 [Suillus fuscotomentosus]